MYIPSKFELFFSVYNVKDDASGISHLHIIMSCYLFLQLQWALLVHWFLSLTLQLHIYCHVIYFLSCFLCHHYLQIPFLLLVDQLKSCRVLEHLLLDQAQQAPRNKQVISGMIFSPYFQLDELAFPCIAFVVTSILSVALGRELVKHLALNSRTQAWFVQRIQQLAVHIISLTNAVP